MTLSRRRLLAAALEAGPLTATDLADKWIGTFSPSLAVKIQQKYPHAFFDRHLRHRRQPLLEGANPPFPGVHFVP